MVDGGSSRRAVACNENEFSFLPSGSIVSKTDLAPVERLDSV